MLSQHPLPFALDNAVVRKSLTTLRTQNYSERQTN